MNHRIRTTAVFYPFVPIFLAFVTVLSNASGEVNAIRNPLWHGDASCLQKQPNPFRKCKNVNARTERNDNVRFQPFRTIRVVALTSTLRRLRGGGSTPPPDLPPPPSLSTPPDGQSPQMLPTNDSTQGGVPAQLAESFASVSKESGGISSPKMDGELSKPVLQTAVTDATPEALTATEPQPQPQLVGTGEDKTVAVSKWKMPPLKDITKRSVGAVVALIFAALVAKVGTEGVVALAFASQLAMYWETCRIIEEYSQKTKGIVNLKRQTYQKYWWFATVSMATSIKALVCTSHMEGSTGILGRIDKEAVDLVAYGMAALGLVKAVMGMELHEKAGPEAFRIHLAKMATCLFSLLFVVAQSSFWILTVHEFGISWIVYPSLLVIVNDTMAYVFGCLLGKNKLLPRMSPAKTVEGFLGAGLSTLLVSIPLLRFVMARSVAGRESPMMTSEIVEHALVLSTFVSVIAPFGGFFASAVKRAFGTKDFGALIPGHGGVMDRFDCHVVTAPFVYLYLREFLGRPPFGLTLVVAPVDH